MSPPTRRAPGLPPRGVAPADGLDSANPPRMPRGRHRRSFAEREAAHRRAALLLNGRVMAGLA